MSDAPWSRSVALLALCQALFQTIAILYMTFGGLVGAALAPSGDLATLPIAATVVGTAAATIPASLLMRRYGRRAGFRIGTLIGAGGGALSAAAVLEGGFWAFCAGHLLLGAYQGFAQYYRFAAAEVAPAERRGRAISLVLTGGVAAALVGPLLGRASQGAVDTPHLGPYLAFVALSLAATLVLGFVRFAPPPVQGPAGSGRPLSALLRQPVFAVAVLGAAAGSSVMTFAMTATPLAMVGHHHSVADAASVIQWHVLGMFVPSFFTGGLIGRHGAPAVMLAGVALLAGHVGIALSGADYLHFLSALVLLGVGWNFLYIGGTTLLTEAVEPAERSKAQAFNDFTVFGFVTLASLGSGALLQRFGWDAVNLFAIAPLLLAGAAILWLTMRRRGAGAAVAGAGPAE